MFRKQTIFSFLVLSICFAAALAYQLHFSKPATLPPQTAENLATALVCTGNKKIVIGQEGFWELFSPQMRLCYHKIHGLVETHYRGNAASNEMRCHFSKADLYYQTAECVAEELSFENLLSGQAGSAKHAIISKYNVPMLQTFGKTSIHFSLHTLTCDKLSLDQRINKVLMQSSDKLVLQGPSLFLSAREGHVYFDTLRRPSPLSCHFKKEVFFQPDPCKKLPFDTICSRYLNYYPQERRVECFDDVRLFQNHQVLMSGKRIEIDDDTIKGFDTLHFFPP